MKSEVSSLREWSLSSYENLSLCSPCVPWIFLVAYGKKSLEEIFNKNMAYGQKYIIGIYAETKISNL